MMRESDRLYEICQQFHRKVDHHFKAECEAFRNGDITAEEINGAARRAWLDAWQIIIDHMWQLAVSVSKGEEGES
jgi:hypothetical protein